ncbi:MAG: hypothetical protein JRF33_20975 [Deltaproteobacteria bacterium]|nr:hypothetical protein [Deltaproteobacteria bacterium]
MTARHISIWVILACLLMACAGPADTEPTDSGLPPDLDDDRDGVLTSVELEAGTDPMDPSSAPAWQPQWSGHPRLLFDAETWSQIKASILAEDPAYLPFYDRLKQAGLREIAPHEEESFMPRLHEQNSRTLLGAALTYAVEEDPAARTHVLDLLSVMRSDVGTLSIDELDGATIHTSEAMINLCQAYDLLAADEEIESALREHLRAVAAEWMAFYSQGLGQAVLLLTQNNHNIKGASGLAMVGMTLNDLPEAAGYVNYGLHDAWYFLTEYQSPVGGGQAEGPTYLAYSALNYLPVFWAYHRFAQGESWPYKNSCLHRNEACEERIVELDDPLTESILPTIHAWWRRIAMPSGYGPNIEDSNLHCLANGAIACMWQDGEAAWRDSQLSRCAGHAWDTEMLRLAVTHRMPEPEEPALLELDVMPEAGQAVFRTSWQEDAIYGLLNGEHDLARAHGFGHEQPDATAF